jgi:hypothetical protein
MTAFLPAPRYVLALAAWIPTLRHLARGRLLHAA